MVKSVRTPVGPGPGSGQPLISAASDPATGIRSSSEMVESRAKVAEVKTLPNSTNMPYFLGSRLSLQPRLQGPHSDEKIPDETWSFLSHRQHCLQVDSCC